MGRTMNKKHVRRLKRRWLKYRFFCFKKRKAAPSSTCASEWGISLQMHTSLFTFLLWLWNHVKRKELLHDIFLDNVYVYVNLIIPLFITSTYDTAKTHCF